MIQQKNMRHWRLLVLAALGALLALMMGTMLQAQVVTSTPASIRLASVTPLPQATEPAAAQSDFEISGDTATPRGIVMLEPISEVNVRTSPEIADDNQLGVIRAGDRFMVLGQYFNWIEFQYDLSPTGRAWVYGDLVNIIGDDLSVIPTVAVDVTPTQDAQFAGATQTREAILAEPGGELTVTALSRVVQLPEGVEQAAGGDGIFNPNETPLPTFTYPPGVIAGVPTLAVTREIQVVNAIDATGNVPDTVPPIIPIAVLGSFGVLGLLVSLLRG